MSEEILWPQDTGKSLTKYLSNVFHGRKYTHFMPESFNNYLLEYLPKIAKHVECFRLFGETRVPLLFTDDSKIATLSWGAVFRFTFEKKEIVAFRYAYPREGVNVLFFFQHDAFPTIIHIIKKLQEFQKKKKEVYIYNRGWVPLDKLDTEYFVMPSMVKTIFDSEVMPQLKTRSIHNHALLYSPPGYGKTAFIRSLCKEWEEWTFMISDPATLEKPVQVFDVFNNAATYEPSIIFFEDIDTLGRNRGQVSEYNPFLGALLSAVDGLETHRGIYVIASTNNPQAIDPALRRAGRFGLHIPFRYTRQEIVQILNKYLGTNYSREEASFIESCTPSQVRSIAKSVLGKVAIMKTPLTLDLVKHTLKTMPKEEVLVTDFSPQAFRDIGESHRIQEFPK